MWTVYYQDVAARPPAGSSDDPNTLVNQSLQLASFEAQFSWGVQPGQARATYVGPILTAGGSIRAYAGIPRNSYVQLRSLAGHVFHGICMSCQSVDSDGGKELQFSFSDLREYLAADGVRGRFNIPDTQYVPSGGGYVRSRRFRHLLPGNWANGIETWTDAPYSAAQILDFLFGAPTIQSPWVAWGPQQYHPAMYTTPVYDLDFGDGTQLSQAVVAVSERLGMVFTLSLIHI